MARKQQRPYLDNPWGLTAAELHALWMLTEFSREEITKKLCQTYRAVVVLIARAQKKIGAGTTTAAVVELDRWWQGAKRGASDIAVHIIEVSLLEPVST